MTLSNMPVRVLVVDDDQSARLLLDKVLAKAGYTTTFTETVYGGVEIMRGNTFDLLITDKNLPDADGFSLLRQARNLQPELSAIMITGFPTPETRAIAEGLGRVIYLAKPFGVAEMLAACRQALELPKPAQAME